MKMSALVLLLVPLLVDSLRQNKRTAESRVRVDDIVLSAQSPWPRKPRKWAADVDEFAERIQSGKAAGLSAIAGSVIHAPIAVSGAIILGRGFTGDWEFSVDMLAVSLALFGVVYRYAIRSDPNPNLKQGVVGAFAITRAVNLVHIPSTCTSLPLNCGAPLGYLSYDTIGQLLLALGPSLLAYGAAALALEKAFEKQWISKMV